MPTVSAVASTRNLKVTWTAPATGGAAVTDYDVRFYQGAADPEKESDWILENGHGGLTDPGTSTSVTISGLRVSSPYRVQLRATNSAGTSAWSASGTATTNAATSTTNNAPVGLQLNPVSSTKNCTVIHATFYKTISGAAGTQVAEGPLVGQGNCGNIAESLRQAPMFHDPDGDSTLTFTAWVSNLPANVRLGDRIPFPSPTTTDKDGQLGVVFLEGAAALQQTNVEVWVLATDPHGASTTREVHFQVGPMRHSVGAPSFSGNAVDWQFAENLPIGSFTLPPATGGDVSFTSPTNSTYSFPHYYTVAGLPPGLVFDPATRTVSGTPTQAGSYTVTYRADDADACHPGASAQQLTDFSCPAAGDTASQTFTIDVGTLQVHRVRIVSHPTFDADNDGTADTYGRGDWILIDVEFGSERPTVNHLGHTVYGRDVPVAIGGSDAEVRLRLDLGEDDTDPTNSRKVLGSGRSTQAPVAELLHGGQTLRFAYQVQGGNCGTGTRFGDCDSDGVWVQTGDGDQVLFLEGDTTLTHAVTGAPVGLTMAGMQTTGISGHKVDGGKSSTHIGPRPTSAEVNGNTLTVTFNKALATLTSADKAELKFNLHVEGAGQVLGVEGAQHPAAVSASGSTLTLTLNAASKARASDTVTLTYAGDELKGTDGKPVPMFRDLAVTNNTPGTAGPAPVRAVVQGAGTTLRVLFDGALNASSLPAGSAFRITLRDGDADHRYIAGTGTAALGADPTFLVVTLDRAVRPDEQAKLEYAKPASNPLQGSGTGNPAVLSFRQFPVTWITDDTAPAFDGGTVVQTGTNASKMALYFDEALDAAFEPAAGDFEVATGGSAVTVSDVAVAGRSVVLTLGSGASEGTAFTVAYTPGTQRIRDEAGNAAAGFRQTLSAAATGQPGLSEASVDGHLVTLTYDKPLDPESAPAAGQFTLNHPAGEAGGTTYNRNVASVAVAGRTAVLSLDQPVYPCAGASPFTLTYAVPTGTGASPLQGLEGTDAAALTTEAVRNARGGWCGLGWFDSARNGSVIIRAKRPFDTSVALSAAWFAVTASGGPVTVTGAAFSADDPHELTLSLDRAFEPDETVTVSYIRPPGESGLWDVTGKQLADLSGASVTITAALPARLESTATDARGRGVTLAFTQDLAHSGLHGSYTVTVDGERRATVRVFWQDDRVGLVLAEPVRWGQVVTVAYAKPASGAMLYGANRRAVESFGPLTVSNAVARRVNAPATGAPAIGGTARVGETLTATTANIADPDGMTGASYAFQWLLSPGSGSGAGSGGADAEIAGATGSTYTLTTAEEGRTLRVRVSFTDDAGNAEALVSAATAAVLPPLPPLTAEFVGMPAEHNGKRLFTFELRFSENFPGRFDYRILRDHAFQVTEGRVRAAKRVARGQNRRWTISVRPSSFEDVVITLPATTDCAAAGAICTPDGRMLSETVTARVRGPVTLSVADARADEEAGAAVEFVVRLNRAASAAVTVDYATVDGTAAAGEDYTATRGTLTFAPGETSKTVSVPILDDAHDEGEETFRLKLSNAAGAVIADGEAVGTIVNTDVMPRAWLARFGRTVAGQVLDAVGARVDGGAASARVTLGGQEILLGDAAGTVEAPDALRERHEKLLRGEDAPGPEVREMSMRELLLASSFHMASAEKMDAGPRWSLWGRGARTGFDGREGALEFSGDVTTGLVGADYESGRMLMGVALALSAGEGSYEESGMRGEVESSLAGAYPYLRYAVSERLTVWGVAGFGEGDLTLTPEGAASLETDLSMVMAAAGARGALLALGGFELALRSDAAFVRTESEATAGLTASEADTSRLRLALEGSREVRLAAGVLTPTVELGLRHDGGDAETGAGLELGGGLRYASGRLTVELSARGLLAHEENDYEEWGVSASVRYAPNEGGRGLSLRAGSSWGAAGGADRLWSQRAASDLARAGKFEPGEAGLDAEVGYGFDLRRGLLTPYTGVALTGSGETWRAGARWKLGPAFDLALEASLTDPANGADAESGVLLKGSKRW
ncbi:MAG: SwmB domain-containing protein [Rhodospirillales bacterium]|nr:SwmB domain-containing protein [Rhodospirillales bacterium]